MSYIGTSINVSPVIVGTAGAVITNGAGKLVKFDASGNIVLCNTAGEMPLGVLALQTEDNIAIGDSVTVQIKDIGKVIAGGAITIGAALSVDTNGKATVATTGQSVIGFALEAASTDQLFTMQIAKTVQIAN